MSMIDIDVYKNSEEGKSLSDIEVIKEVLKILWEFFDPPVSAQYFVSLGQMDCL